MHKAQVSGWNYKVSFGLYSYCNAAHFPCCVAKYNCASYSRPFSLLEPILILGIASMLLKSGSISCPWRGTCQTEGSQMRTLKSWHRENGDVISILSHYRVRKESHFFLYTTKEANMISIRQTKPARWRQTRSVRFFLCQTRTQMKNNVRVCCRDKGNFAVPSCMLHLLPCKSSFSYHIQAYACDAISYFIHLSSHRINSSQVPPVFNGSHWWLSWWMLDPNRDQSMQRCLPRSMGVGMPVWRRCDQLDHTRASFQGGRDRGRRGWCREGHAHPASIWGTSSWNRGSRSCRRRQAILVRLGYLEACTAY